MDNLTANKSHLPCQLWAGPNGWSATSTQGALSSLPSSQHLGLVSSSDHRSSYDHLQASNQACMSDLSTLSSRNNSHHSALYKVSHISNSSSTTVFSNSALPSASHNIPFAHQNPHTSMLLTENHGKNIPSLPQTNQAPQPCRPQHPSLLSSHHSYKESFQLPATIQGYGLQDLPISLPSCAQHVSTQQAAFEGANVELAGVAGYTHSHASSTSQEQHQWTPSSHCRGAINDTAAHPNTEASNEGRRSALLQRRAQLLKQVAELDKFLESIPPDDSSDGQSQYTSIQSPPSLDDLSQCEQRKTTEAEQVQLSTGASKSHLSAADLSTLSDDVQSETCDSPEDPMSAAESVKKEAESEDDSDADYVPDDDGDVSDFLSDPYGGSSDESTHSSPPTPTDKRLSVPPKKKAKSGSSVSKDQSVSPLEKTCAADQKKKKSSETVVLPCSGSREQRVYDRKNYCLFCSKPVGKMARHLERIHSDKAEVAAAFQYPKNSKERQKIWNRLTNEGNFAHNKDVLKTGKGQLAVRKRPRKTLKAQDFLHCLHCRGLFVKKALFRHMRLCPEKVKNENETPFGRKRIVARCMLEVIGDLGITDGFRSILSQMTYDDVTKTIMDDKVVLQFGELMFNHYGSDEKKHDYMRQNLRQLARLVLEAKKITPLEKLEDFFLPASFPHVVSAVNVLAGYNPENKTYSIPSLAIKLGYHLQKACGIVEANAVKRGDENLAESARSFLSLYQKKWNKLISSGALTTLRKTKLRREKKVPFAQDVKRLNFHLEKVHAQAEEKLRESSSAENYASLSKVILCRTILFNRRRAREVSLVQLTAFMSRKKSSQQVGMDVSVSDLERTMCAFFTRVDIRGKCGRLVPVLLKPSFVSGLELLVELRETCGVPSKNPYLFGRPYALSAYNGSECLQKYVRACGAKDPEALTSAKIRKHYAKMLQLINLDENEANQILGPNNSVRTLRQDSSMQVDDVEMDSHDRVQAARGQQAASWDCSEHNGTEFYDEPAHGSAAHVNRSASARSAKSCKKGSQNNGKHKWEEEEVLAVERHLMPLIQGHKVPQKNDCIQCLEAEPEALKMRSWRGVKDYVRNRITALKRQSRT